MTEYEIKPQLKLSLNLKELWEYRELFIFFTWRDIKVKYKQTVLGFLWAILQPFLMMLIFSFFLGSRLYDSNEKLPYPVFVYSGLLLWNIFSSGTASAGNSMINNANIIKKIYFPRLIIPISSILISIFDFLMASIIFIGILFFYPVDTNIFKLLVYIPSSIIITCIATFGLGTLLSALNIKYRDFRYIIPFMLQALLFVSPIFYNDTILQQKWQGYLMALNPMYAPIQLFRNAFSETIINTPLILISTTSSLIFLIAGLYYFRRTEAYFADIV